MKYIISHSNDPAFNIAQEAYAFREMLDEDEILFYGKMNQPLLLANTKMPLKKSIKSIQMLMTFI